MRRHLPVLILISTLIPLIAIGWLGLNLADKQQMATEMRFNKLFERRLEELTTLINEDILIFRRNLERKLNQLPDNWEDAKRTLATGPSLIDIHFVLDSKGALAYPEQGIPTLTNEQLFLHKTRRIWNDSLLLQSPSAVDIRSEELPEKPDQSNSISKPSFQSQSPVSRKKARTRPTVIPPFSDALHEKRDFGWYTWYLDDGINLLFWHRLPDGGVVGIETDRLELLARLIGILPSESGTLPNERIQLLDAQNRTLYQWGGHEPTEGDSPATERPLAPPLQSWRLRYHVNPDQLAGDGSLRRLQLFTLLGGMLLVLLSVAIFLYREVKRTLREASQRVNFVNQVSHELKTPLTNIRLYAELLQGDMERDEASSHRVAIIVAETGRLSRLIGNVLSFSRNQRQTLRLRRSSMNLDECVAEVLDPFRPALAQPGFEIKLQLNAPGKIEADRDAIAQIIGNLVGNVEKYAASGKMLCITSQQTEKETRLDIQDLGPGIARRHRKRIFTAFYRIRNDLTEGVSGTGIGLSIAAELAALHGGKLTLESCPAGSLFRLVLPNRGRVPQFTTIGQPNQKTGKQYESHDSRR